MEGIEWNLVYSWKQTHKNKRQFFSCQFGMCDSILPYNGCIAYDNLVEKKMKILSKPIRRENTKKERGRIRNQISKRKKSNSSFTNFRQKFVKR